MTFTKLISSTYSGPPQKGVERILEKYLWMPTNIKGEVRWFAHAKIRQVYTNWEAYSYYGCEWHNVEFINDDNK